jgi:hypothetical protein
MGRLPKQLFTVDNGVRVFTKASHFVYLREVIKTVSPDIRVRSLEDGARLRCLLFNVAQTDAWIKYAPVSHTSRVETENSAATRDECTHDTSTEDTSTTEPISDPSVSTPPPLTTTAYVAGESLEQFDLSTVDLDRLPMTIHDAEEFQMVLEIPIGVRLQDVFGTAIARELQQMIQVENSLRSGFSDGPVVVVGAQRSLVKPSSRELRSRADLIFSKLPDDFKYPEPPEDDSLGLTARYLALAQTEADSNECWLIKPVTKAGKKFCQPTHRVNLYTFGGPCRVVFSDGLWTTLFNIVYNGLSWWSSEELPEQEVIQAEEEILHRIESKQTGKIPVSWQPTQNAAKIQK